MCCRLFLVVCVLVCGCVVVFLCPWMLCVNYCVMAYGVLCVVVFVCVFNLFVWFVSELSCDVVCVFFF